MALPLRALLFLLVLVLSPGCGASVHDLVREGRWRDAHERAGRSDDAETRRVYAEAEVQARRPHIRVTFLSEEQLIAEVGGPLRLEDVRIVEVAYEWQSIEGVDTGLGDPHPRIAWRRGNRSSGLRGNLPGRVRVTPAGVRYPSQDLRVIGARAVDATTRFLTRNSPEDGTHLEAAARRAVRPHHQAVNPMMVLQTRLSRSDVCEATASGGRCTRWEVLEPAVTRDSPGPDALTIGWVSSIDTPVSWEVPVTESQLATGVDTAYPR